MLALPRPAVYAKPVMESSPGPEFCMPSLLAMSPAPLSAPPLFSMRLFTHFHHVAAAGDGEVVRVVVGGGGEQLLGADVGVAQAGSVREARNGKQSRAGVLHAQFAGDVARPFIRASFVQHEVIHADARLIHQPGTDGPRPVDDAVLEGSDVEAVIQEGSRVDARLIQIG